jgi:tRNA threonylcarbamoyladenosine biosynthesis protein TsaB
VARDGTVLAERALRAQGSHAASLPGLVDRVLAESGLGVEDVEAVAISIGPGSFTGLRIGLGFAKGLCFAGDLPLVTVPTLEALAHAVEAPADATVCAALDARKREVYAALFAAEPAGGRRRLGPDEALAPDALAARLPPGCLLVGDAAAAYPAIFVARARVLSFDRHPPRGGVVALLGWRRLVAGERADLGAVEPAYVRPAEAELARGPLR